MSQTRDYAERMSLAAMVPSPEIASTAYCLVSPGKEYLVYLPEGGTVIVDLSVATGDLSVEWFDPTRGRAVAGEMTRGGKREEFKSPWSGAAVLYIVIAH
jgi:hypothetical protein